MTIYNREDYRTVLPQIEKSIQKVNETVANTNDRIDDMLKVETITPTAHLCTKGTATACYKIGNIVFLSFNIQIGTSGLIAYLKDLPKPIHNCACCSSTGRFRIDTAGELVSEESLTANSWHNGSIVYITKE